MLQLALLSALLARKLSPGFAVEAGAAKMNDLSRDPTLIVTGVGNIVITIASTNPRADLVHVPSLGPVSLLASPGWRL
jgi:hypothetical protein